jgi:hypothetical protein
MSDEIEQRLTAAAQAAREYVLCGQRHAQARARAQAAAEDLDAAQREYAGGHEPTAPRLEVTAGLKFADIFFNNIFTDLAVGHQIRDAQDNVDRSIQQVRSLQDRLKSQITTVSGRLEMIVGQRQQLLTQ